MPILTKSDLGKFGGPQHTFVLNGATPVTVLFPNMTLYSQVLITLMTPGGTVGAQPVLTTKTVKGSPTAGFTVAGTAGDTSVYCYRVI